MSKDQQQTNGGRPVLFGDPRLPDRLWRQPHMRTAAIAPAGGGEIAAPAGYGSLHDNPDDCPTWYDGCQCAQENFVILLRDARRDLADAENLIEQLTAQRDVAAAGYEQVRRQLAAERCLGLQALEEAVKEVRTLESRLAEVEGALRELFDEQNDAPVETRRTQWGVAMKRARRALATPDRSETDAD